MKFVELKKTIKNELNKLYILSGDDRFLCFNALEIIKKRIGLTFADLNSASFADDNFSEQALIESCYVLPFGDEHRLIIVKGVGNLKKAGEKIVEYFKKPNDTTIVVFVCPEKLEYVKAIESYATIVDCNTLDEQTLSNWIVNFLNKRNVQIEKEAVLRLIEYTSGKLTRISAELEKMASFVGENGKILEKTVNTFVVKDREYQIYELTEALAQGKADLCFEMLQTILDTKKSEFSIVTPLYNYFRRLLYIKTSKLGNAELAREFGNKEYAVKKMREKTNFYTAKSLKRCVELLAECDLNIKSGKMASDVAVKFVILQIIQMRNK